GATAKLLAPILLAAACSGGSMAQVVAWIDSQESGSVERALEANNEEEAANAFEAIALWDDRTRGRVHATAQTVRHAHVHPRGARPAPPAAPGRPPAGGGARAPRRAPPRWRPAHGLSLRPPPWDPPPPPLFPASRGGNLPPRLCPPPGTRSPPRPAAAARARR